MIKCEVTLEFTLGKNDKYKFEYLRNIVRKGKEERGKLFVGDIFECNKDIAEYLTGKNDKKLSVVKVLEIIPEKEKKETNETKKEEVKPEVKRTTRRKTTRRK